MIVLCDIDGVLADFIGHVRTRCDVTSPITSWNLETQLTDEEMARVNKLSHDPLFCLDIPWYPGADEFFTNVRNIPGVEVYAVTAPWPSKHWVHERKQWLAEHLPGWRVLAVAGRAKHMVRGDVLIEDHPGTVAQWLRAHPQGYAILMDRPWNQPESRTFKEAKLADVQARMFRTDDYDHALGLIEGVKWSLDSRL